jgi:hypothetical protein
MSSRVMLYKSPRITIIIEEGQSVAYVTMPGADVPGNPDHGYNDAAKTGAKKVPEKVAWTINCEESEPVLPELDALNEEIWFS